MPLLRFASVVFLVFPAFAGVADRVAVIVGNQVITVSEVDEEVRVTAFENQEPLSLSPEAQRAAADRLVDQQLLRGEMALNSFQAPPATDADALARNFREQHFPSAAAFQNALVKYGITEGQFKQHLLWQETLVRFTDFRFRPGGTNPPVQTASRLRAGAAAPPEETVDQQMETWLRQARAQTRVQFKKEAFQ